MSPECPELRHYVMRKMVGRLLGGHGVTVGFLPKALIARLRA
jgi:hypothetical protein